MRTVTTAELLEELGPTRTATLAAWLRTGAPRELADVGGRHGPDSAQDALRVLSIVLLDELNNADPSADDSEE